MAIDSYSNLVPSRAVGHSLSSDCTFISKDNSTIRTERKVLVAGFTNQLDGIYVSVLGSREN